MTERSGRCLCGAVRFTAEVGEEFGACHCSMCRRWGGAPGMAIDGHAVRFEGAENIVRYRSSESAERGFCRICGSSMFYKMFKDDKYELILGALDDQDGLVMTRQIYIDEKPAHYEFANQTRTLTGAEVEAIDAAQDRE